MASPTSTIATFPSERTCLVCNARTRHGVDSPKESDWQGLGREIPLPRESSMVDFVFFFSSSGSLPVGLFVELVPVV